MRAAVPPTWRMTAREAVSRTQKNRTLLSWVSNFWGAVHKGGSRYA